MITSRVVGLALGLGGALVGGCAGHTAKACYSPSQNLESAYAPGGGKRAARGCPCVKGRDKDVCVTDGTGRRVALVCGNQGWMSVEDGPCGGG